VSNDLRKLLAAGTARPWEWDDKDDRIRHLTKRNKWGGVNNEDYVNVATGGSIGYENARLNMSEEDARLAIAAVNSVQGLLDRINQLEVALVAACDLADEGWSYAGEYFNDKYDAKSRSETLRATAQNIESERKP